MVMFDEEKHMGHILFESMIARPDSLCQIDASTGESESNASVLRRSVSLACCLRGLGLAPGDVLALSGRNHLHLQIPYTAALFNGLPITGIDPTYTGDEMKSIFKVIKPKVAFCEPTSYDDYVTAAADLGLATRVFTFGHGEHSMQELLDTYKHDTPVEEFEIAKIDPATAYMWLVSSGGTTGVMKLAAVTHDAFKHKLRTMLTDIFGISGWKDHPHQPALHLSSIQWFTGILNLIGMPILHQTRILTSAPVTADHVIDIINKFKPVTTLISPALVSGILKSTKPCDLTCFLNISLGGVKIYNDLLLELRTRVNKASLVLELYGQTENLGPVFTPSPQGPVGNCGKPSTSLLVKLVNPETEKEIADPNVTGELWTKGIGFSCYYNNPEETAAAFSEDGWFKTGDLLYRDADNNYFFVERRKMLIKYKGYLIMPLEIEAVIRDHKAVADVSVTSVLHETDVEHPVACVVKRGTVTAQEIKELVASKLSESKHLRGGVVFLDKLPTTHAGKVARGKLKQLVRNMSRE